MGHKFIQIEKIYSIFVYLRYEYHLNLIPIYPVTLHNWEQLSLLPAVVMDLELNKEPYNHLSSNASHQTQLDQF